jgi:hypothetical protein
MVFRTYGSINEPPDMPTIDGTTSGKAGTIYYWNFTSIDPQGHDVYYYVDWGDECPAVDWQGPYPSGTSAEFSHTYASQGDYQIGAVAKDSFDLEGDWAYLNVEMPRDKIVFKDIFSGFSQLINFFQLIQKILS